MRARFIVALLCLPLLGAGATPEYTIEAIRVADSPHDA